MPGFPYNLLSVSCGDIGFKKNTMSNTGLEIRPLGAFLPLGPSCTLQTILLSDLIRCVNHVGKGGSSTNSLPLISTKL
jgi:hypothetical protein